MTRQTVVGAGPIKRIKGGCGWQFCTGKHNIKPKHPDRKKGNISRENSKPKGYIEPWAIGTVSYTQFGIKSGYTEGFSSGSYNIKKAKKGKGKKHRRNYYTTQYHHVISVK